MLLVASEVAGLNLIDLAGSERQQALEGIQVKGACGRGGLVGCLVR